MTSTRPRFLVTGCAGFIGGHMLDRLLNEGYPVVGVDDFSTGSRQNLDRWWGKFEFIHGNLCQPAIAAQAVAGVEYVIHLASIPSVPRSLEQPVESAMSTVISTVTLLDAAVKAGVKRLVQASSSSVYGDALISPKSESLPPQPLSPYAAAKLAQEQYARVFSRCWGIETLSLRYFNVFGPRQNPNSQYAAAIPKFIAALQNGLSPVIFGDGEQTRDFTYVESVVEANLRAALAPGVFAGEVANVGSGEAISVNALVAELNRLLGTAISPLHSAPRAGDVRHSLADLTQAGRLFGYTPCVDLREGLRRTVASFSVLR